MMKHFITDTAAQPPVNMRRRLLSCGLVLICALLALLLAVFIAVSAVVMESHTYKRAAKEEAYLAGVESAVVDIMKETAKEEGLSKTMLMKHVQSDEIRKLAKQNATDAALVLKGSQVIYGQSFDKPALQTVLYKFYEQRLPEEAPTEKEPTETPADGGTTEAPTNDEATDPNAEQTTENPDSAGPLQKTGEDSAREELREECDELASEISAEIDAAVRVIDMEQVVYDAVDETLIDWLRFMGRGGVLLPLLLLAMGLLVLYRLTWERGFSPWLTAVCICSGILSLVPAGAIIAGGWLDLSVEPVQLDILYETILQGILAEFIAMAILWFIIGYIALRAAIGKPVSTERLRALLALLRKDTAPAGTTTAVEVPSDDTADADVHSKTDRPVSSNQALLETIKKAAADSTNSLLGRKGR